MVFLLAEERIRYTQRCKENWKWPSKEGNFILRSVSTASRRSGVTCSVTCGVTCGMTCGVTYVVTSGVSCSVTWGLTCDVTCGVTCCVSLILARQGWEKYTSC